MGTERVLIGLDIGNTNLKAIAFTPSGDVIASTSLSTREVKGATVHIPPLHLEMLIDPVLLLNAIQTLIGDLSANLERIATHASVRAIAVTGMGGPMVALDQQNVPVYPVISLWPIDVQETVLADRDKEFYEVTGYHPHNSPFATVAWLAQHDPSRFRRVTQILPVVSYVTQALSGVAVCDPSLASGTGIWDQGSGHWAREIISAAAVSPDCFPPVTSAGTLIGPLRSSVASRTGLSETTLVAVGGHDYLCAAGALGITKPGTMLNMLGTYEILATPHRSAPVVQPSDVDLIDDTHVYPKMRALMFQVIGGGHLEWLRHMLTGGLDEPASLRQWHQILARSAQIRDEDMANLVFAPFLFGRFFPERCIHPHGALLGLSERHGPEHVARAMIDALSYVSMEAVKTLEAIQGEDITKIIVTGGGTQNALWVQRKADFLQTPLLVPYVTDTSALGAALAAGIAVGVYTDWDQAARTLAIPWAEIAPGPPVDRQYLDQFIRWDDVSPNACAHTVDLSRRIAQEITTQAHTRHMPATGA
ncbi:MAG: xylulose kinase [Sulfobacillus benefaciens]|uniref:Xylulose kinase n=1 Tax=Sulfobacillus benefaciens TaxID=453960 RepID=A0A2T2XCN8_9FIRM|nr:MAG: xylulose kinase [Sulfobacillus benefaciens]